MPVITTTSILFFGAGAITIEVFRFIVSTICHHIRRTLRQRRINSPAYQEMLRQQEADRTAALHRLFEENVRNIAPAHESHGE